MKIKWTVTEGDIRRKWDSMSAYLAGDWPRWIMPYLAEHAAIEVPPGVPPLEELAKLLPQNAQKFWFKDWRWHEFGPDYQQDAIRIAAAIRDAVVAGLATKPTDAQVEALARVLHKVKYDNPCEWMADTEWGQGFIREARAAFAHIGAVRVVDPDAWASMKPVVIDLTNGCELYLNETDYLDMDLVFSHKGEPQKRYWINPEMARKLAIAAASYAAAHGCPVDLRTPLSVTDCPHCNGSGSALAPSPPIADADTLEKLAEIGCEAAARLARKGPVLDSKEYNLAFTAAILRAAKARVEIDEEFIDLSSDMELPKFEAAINSRIRFGVEVPTAEELADIVHEIIMNPSLKAPVSPHISNAILAALRPWLRDPVGWELDVTAEEAAMAYKTNVGGDGLLYGGVCAILALCRSRIRPVFDCQNCAKKNSKYVRLCEAYDEVEAERDKLKSAVEAFHAALEGE